MNKNNENEMKIDKYNEFLLNFNDNNNNEYNNNIKNDKINDILSKINNKIDNIYNNNFLYNKYNKYLIPTSEIPLVSLLIEIINNEYYIKNKKNFNFSNNLLNKYKNENFNLTSYLIYDYKNNNNLHNLFSEKNEEKIDSIEDEFISLYSNSSYHSSSSEENSLPASCSYPRLRFTSLTPCFRVESQAMSGGKDSRGLIRRHQFNKLELVSLTHPDYSKLEHLYMINCVEELLQMLELPYRKVLLSR